MVKQLLSVFFVCGFAAIGIAQILPFKPFGVKEGLTHSDVYDVLQDRLGYIWVATGDGVCRYNGHAFDAFNIEDGLSGSMVRSIVQDSSGMLWFGGMGGLTSFNGSKFKPYSLSDGLPNDTVMVVYVSSDNTLWIGTFGGGVSKFDGRSFTNYSTRNGLAGNRIVSIAQDKIGQMLFGSQGGGMTVYDGHSFRIVNRLQGLGSERVEALYVAEDSTVWIGTYEGLYTFKNDEIKRSSLNQYLNSREVKSITADSKKRLWVGTTKGVCIMDDDQVKELSRQNGLLNNYIRKVFIDRQGACWLGTRGGGVYEFDSKCFQIFTKEHGLASDFVISVREDQDKVIWAGTNKGLFLKAKNDLFFKQAPGILGKSSIMAICQDQSRAMWFGSFGNGVYKYYNGKIENYNAYSGLVNDYVLYVFQDRAGNYWFGTYDGVSMYNGSFFKSIKKEQGLADNQVRYIYEDRLGRIWFATNKGLTRFDGDRYTSYHEHDGLAHSRVMSVCEDERGHLWCATDGGGLSVFDGSSFKTINRASGLKSNNIWVMIPDNNGHIWVGHQKGIERLSTEDHSIRFYGYKQGFTPIEVNVNAACADAVGNLWFGTIEGLVKYSPHDDVVNPHPPILHITAVEVHKEGAANTDEKLFASRWNVSTGVPENLELPHDINNITFTYNGMHTQLPKKNILYKYRLTGLEKDWQEPTDQSRVTFYNLIPGKYRFEILSSCEGEIWNTAPVQVSFTIGKPYWERWWFYALEVTFFLLLLAISIYFNHRNSEARLAAALMFISLLIFVEFIIMITESYLDNYMGGVPLAKLVLNVLLAMSFQPIEKISVRWIRRRRSRKTTE